VLRDEIKDRVGAMGDEETRVLSDGPRRPARIGSVRADLMVGPYCFGILLLVYLIWTGRSPAPAVGQKVLH